MATCTVLSRKTGERYIKIRCKPHRGGQEFTKVFDFPQTWGNETALKRAAKVAEEFEADCKAGKVKPKRNRQEVEEPKDTRTLKGYAENVYLPQLVRASKYTLDNYERYLKNQVFPILGQLPLDEITPAQIKALLLDMQGKGYKVATCVKVYTILQGVFGLAFDEEVLTVNPMHRVKRPKPTAEEGIKTAPPAYTAEEVKAIMDAAEALPVKWRTLFLLLCETGCRRGEALGLKWGNIEQEAGTVSFVRSLGYTDKDGFFEKPPKNGRGRTVYVSPQLLKLFDDLRQEQEAETGDGFPGIKPHSGNNDFVFQTDARGGAIRPDTVTRKLESFGSNHGFKGLHPHKLRHTFASVAIENGADIPSTAAILGHANPATTMRIYTHTNPEAMKRTGSIFLDALEPKKKEEKGK